MIIIVSKNRAFKYLPCVEKRRKGKRNCAETSV